MSMQKYTPEFPAADHYDTSSSGAAPAELNSPTIFYDQLSLDLDSIRNPKIREFFNQQTFMPYYWQEINIATEKLGLADALFRARFSRNNVHNPLENQIRAAENTYERAEGYAKKSGTDLRTLRLAFEEDQELPSPAEIRANPQILDVIARFILAFRKVEAENWPAWNAGVLTSALAQIKERLAETSDEELVALWNMTRESNNQRLKFWDSQLASIKGNKIVEDIVRLRNSRHATQPAPGSIQIEAVEEGDTTEQEAEPETLIEKRPANMLPNGAMTIEGTEVPLADDRPATPRVRLPKQEEQTQTLFAVPRKPARESRRAKPVRGVLAMFADNGRIPQHELDRTAGRESPEPIVDPDAEITKHFGEAKDPSGPYLRFK